MRDAAEGLSAGFLYLWAERFASRCGPYDILRREPVGARTQSSTIVRDHWSAALFLWDNPVDQRNNVEPKCN